MTITAYIGVALPDLLYGTAWKKEATSGLVQQAVAAGFRGIDTANQLIHYRETGVGEALLELRKSGIARDSLFLQTKFTPLNGQGGQPPYDPSVALAEQVRQSFESSLAHLHTDTLDSYVLHGPYSRRGLGDADREVWGAIEDLYRSGRVRMIGISNVTAPQLEQLCAEAKTRPMVVQNRCYAVMGWDRDVREICRAQGIVYQGFSLLTANLDVLAQPLFRDTAARVRAGVAQVVFRFAQQIGMLPLTGTTDAEHMKEDLAAERLTLTDDEIRRIEAAGL